MTEADAVAAPRRSCSDGERGEHEGVQEIERTRAVTEYGNGVVAVGAGELRGAVRAQSAGGGSGQ